MRMPKLFGCILSLFLATGAAWAAEDAAWSFGTSRARITPKELFWMGGFAARTRPAEGTLDDLWVKALALRAPDGGVTVIVTADLVGIPKWMYEAVVSRLQREHSLDRSRILMATSHTHSGPVLRDALQDIYPLDEPQRKLIAKYSDWLAEPIVATVGEAMARRSPARLWAGEGQATFALNRLAAWKKRLEET